mgnify:FL=1
MTRTTVDSQSLLDEEALERTPELIKELQEALRRERPVTVSHTRVTVEPFQGLDGKGYPIWGEPETWHLVQKILGKIDDPVEGPLVQVGELEYVKGPFCCI